MTYQKPSRNDDPAEESSLFRNVVDVSSSTFSSAVFGPEEADEELVVPWTVRITTVPTPNIRVVLHHVRRRNC